MFFFEEPCFTRTEPYLAVNICQRSGVTVCTPHLPDGTGNRQSVKLQRQLVSESLKTFEIEEYLSWYYTPMALEFTDQLEPVVTVYDCMDELSAFAGAPPDMAENEKRLLASADLVFTGGASLYQAKSRRHPAVHKFPSSIDVSHFKEARGGKVHMPDQDCIPEPRFGYAGVIDERLDINLLSEAARHRPQWQFVLIGPIAKISESSLPRGNNIHYLGMKPYEELPSYFSGWRVGTLPFQLNRSTEFISPTKTPEYLAAGLRVISTAIRDVVTPYGEAGLVEIVRNVKEFLCAGDRILLDDDRRERLAAVDAFLADFSWDTTWTQMNSLLQNMFENNKRARANTQYV